MNEAALRAVVQAELARRGWNVPQLARACRGLVPERTLYRWLHQDREVGSFTAGKVLLALGLEISRPAP